MTTESESRVGGIQVHDEACGKNDVGSGNYFKLCNTQFLYLDSSRPGPYVFRPT